MAVFLASVLSIFLRFPISLFFMVFILLGSCSPGQFVNGTACSLVPAGAYNPYWNTPTYYGCSTAVLAGAAICSANGGNCPAGTYFSGTGCPPVPAGWIGGIQFVFPFTSESLTIGLSRTHHNTAQPTAGSITKRSEVGGSGAGTIAIATTQ